MFPIPGAELFSKFITNGANSELHYNVSTRRNYRYCDGGPVSVISAAAKWETVFPQSRITQRNSPPARGKKAISVRTQHMCPGRPFPPIRSCFQIGTSSTHQGGGGGGDRCSPWLEAVIMPPLTSRRLNAAPDMNRDPFHFLFAWQGHPPEIPAPQQECLLPAGLSMDLCVCVCV